MIPFYHYTIAGSDPTIPKRHIHGKTLGHITCFPGMIGPYRKIHLLQDMQREYLVLVVVLYKQNPQVSKRWLHLELVSGTEIATRDPPRRHGVYLEVRYGFHGIDAADVDEGIFSGVFAQLMIIVRLLVMTESDKRTNSYG
jgi:hypothetical protein